MLEPLLSSVMETSNNPFEIQKWPPTATLIKEIYRSVSIMMEILVFIVLYNILVSIFTVYFSTYFNEQNSMSLSVLSITMDK